MAPRINKESEITPPTPHTSVGPYSPEKKNLDMREIIYESKNYNNYNIIIISFKHRGYDYYVLVIINTSTNDIKHSRGFRWSTLSKGNSLSSEHLDFFSLAAKSVSTEYLRLLKSAVLNKKYRYEARKILKKGFVLSATLVRTIIGFLLSMIQVGVNSLFELDPSYEPVWKSFENDVDFYDSYSDPSGQIKYRMNTLIRKIEEIIKKLENNGLEVENFITRFFEVLIELSNSHRIGIDINGDFIDEIQKSKQGGYRELPKRKKRKNTMRKKRKNTKRKNTKRKNTRRKNTKRKNTKRKSSKRE